MKSLTAPAEHHTSLPVVLPSLPPCRSSGPQRALSDLSQAVAGAVYLMVICHSWLYATLCYTMLYIQMLPWNNEGFDQRLWGCNRMIYIYRTKWKIKIENNLKRIESHHPIMLNTPALGPNRGIDLGLVRVVCNIMGDGIYKRCRDWNTNLVLMSCDFLSVHNFAFIGFREHVSEFQVVAASQVAVGQSKGCPVSRLYGFVSRPLWDKKKWRKQNGNP